MFTPLEYGSCGLSEEKAVERFGEENIEVSYIHYACVKLLLLFVKSNFKHTEKVKNCTKTFR